MAFQSRNFILLNGAAGLAMAFGTIALIKSIILPDDVERCTARYDTTIPFGIGDDAGAPLEPGALQAQLDASEWGIVRNLRIERAGGIEGLAMRVGLSGALSAPNEGSEQAGGIGFHWQPGFVNTKSSACLSYNIQLPKGFDFHKGGLLPGLFGGQIKDGDTSLSRGFAVRFRWDEGGRGGVRLEKGNLKRYGADQRFELATYKIPVGRWVNLEQEVTLNRPGNNDGVLRLWLDGELVYEASDINYRDSADGQLLGVYGDTRYVNTRRHRASNKQQSLRMTPFNMSWN